MRKHTAATAVLTVLIIVLGGQVMAGSKVEATSGVDLVSRYVWRGLEFGEAPNIQPTLAFGWHGFEVGAWGAYVMSNGDNASNEIDLWLSYSHEIEKSVTVTAMITDYHFPNTGVRWGDWSDYDCIREIVEVDEEQSDTLYGGAHTVELGFGIDGPSSLPISLYGYVNIHNDGGNNAYFQIDYACKVDNTNLDFFIGASPGDKEYLFYGAESAQVINLGVEASRNIKVTADFSIPVFVTFSGNPNKELAYLVFGCSF